MERTHITFTEGHAGKASSSLPFGECAGVNQSTQLALQPYPTNAYIPSPTCVADVDVLIFPLWKKLGVSFAVLIPYWAKMCGIVSLHSPVIPSLEECAMQAAEESNYA